jgi:hypothetical protein
MGGTLTMAFTRRRNAQYGTFWVSGTVRRLVVGACTLLGPEGPNTHALMVWGFFLWAMKVLHHLQGDHGAARILRTTQWTRAS